MSRLQINGREVELRLWWSTFVAKGGMSVLRVRSKPTPKWKRRPGRPGTWMADFNRMSFECIDSNKWLEDPDFKTIEADLQAIRAAMTGGE